MEYSRFSTEINIEHVQNEAEQSIQQSLAVWQQLACYFPAADFGSLPRSINELRQENAGFSHAFSQLSHSRLAFHEFGNTIAGITPEGMNIGESMRFTLIPWRMFSQQLAKRNYGDLPELFYGLAAARDNQNKAAALSYNELDIEIMRCLYANALHYRTSDTTMPETLTAEEYLDYRLGKDGDWGLALIQASNNAGLREQADDSATMTHSGEASDLRIAGQAAGRLGAFELLALTLQEESLVFENKFWLPANIMDPIPSDDTSLPDSLQDISGRIPHLFSGMDKRQVRLAVTV